MVIRHIPDHPDLTYHLIRYDKHGTEIPEDANTWGSEAVRADLESPETGITDVFLLSHGWNSDAEGAMAQYDAWVSMTRDTRPADIGRPFRPLIVGLHWPSKAWGNDTIVATGRDGLLGAEAPPSDAITVDDAVDRYADLLSDTPDARAALRTIFEAAADSGADEHLTAQLQTAYQTLSRELQLGELPDDDHAPAEAWDAESVFQQALEDTSAASGLLGGGASSSRLKDAVLAPFRQLSFWMMKARALAFGETGAAHLLRQLQDAADQDVRFHLMGHSFGCIVVSAAVAGAEGAPEVRPVDSLFLVQGALSLWAYARAVPDEVEPGHFHRILREELVRGPIVTTRSTFDYAVGRFYPLGAGIAGQVLLADLPRYGGLGAFGIQGVQDAKNHEIGDENTDYQLHAGGVYNIDASTVINRVSGPGGAHSDISHPAVAALAWQAALASA
ncbi:hypothetical protein FBY31_1838 [Arthrobacter sp. SLBN-100]|uniref:hypothetical protein n=1 Tax=Arthrobacter sp. SLBN-100 TaxID=2768450 RepID=UPI001152F8DD|nr:hypothetical protein [Arthrobacter sp. SLBN-100]TQJ67760.1 hypothetical protein FBY31_1838 [Arthrobacter sp. SLBN-100]